MDSTCKDELKFFGFVAAFPIGLIGLLSLTPLPQEHGQKPVIEQRIEGANLIGYDFNNDGQLDMAKYCPLGSPRVPGYWISIGKEGSSFASLQEAYQKTQKFHR
jgi:hypothetical protein